MSKIRGPKFAYPLSIKDGPVLPFLLFLCQTSLHPSSIPYISLAKCSGSTSRPRTLQLLLDWTRVEWLYQQSQSLRYSVSSSVFLPLCWSCGMSSKTSNVKTLHRLVGTKIVTPKRIANTTQSNFSHRNRLLLSTNHKRAMRYKNGSVETWASACG